MGLHVKRGFKQDLVSGFLCFCGCRDSTESTSSRLVLARAYITFLDYFDLDVMFLRVLGLVYLTSMSRCDVIIGLNLSCDVLEGVRIMFFGLF